MQNIYLDNSATTKVCETAAQKILEMMTQQYGNPSSLHAMGFYAEQEMEAARREIAHVMGAGEEEIVFTSGGTEANNLAIFGAAYAFRRRGNHIVTTAVEHPSVLQATQALEKEGFEVDYLQPDTNGRISPDQIDQAITEKTILVSIMTVNNETGVIFPVTAAAAAIRRKKTPALLHTDAVQAFGKIDLKPIRNAVSLLTISAHKIHGPKGVGALYRKKGTHIIPRTFGGGQEKGLRPGTEPVPLICGFGAAAKELPNPKQSFSAMQELNQYCRARLLQVDGITIHSPEDALPYVLSISAGTVRAETMLHFLSSKGIYVSSGSACSRAKPSHVLKAMKLPEQQILSSLRISFSRFTKKEEIDALVQGLQEGMAQIAKRPLK